MMKGELIDYGYVYVYETKEYARSVIPVATRNESVSG